MIQFQISDVTEETHLNTKLNAKSPSGGAGGGGNRTPAGKTPTLDPSSSTPGKVKGQTKMAADSCPSDNLPSAKSSPCGHVTPGKGSNKTPNKTNNGKPISKANNSSAGGTASAPSSSNVATKSGKPPLAPGDSGNNTPKKDKHKKLPTTTGTPGTTATGLKDSLHQKSNDKEAAGDGLKHAPALHTSSSPVPKKLENAWTKKPDLTSQVVCVLWSTKWQ